MANTFWQKIDEIFPQVADLPETERERRLVELCGDDEHLRREISAMLAVDEKAEKFIETPVAVPNSLSGVFAAVRESAAHPTLDLAGQRFGAYRIISKIGAGGMGAVYLAERADGEFSKRAAIKFVKSGSDSAFNLRRFRHERQILAALEHPNIARLLDGGTAADGSPFLIMEYVEGAPFFEFCARQNLNLDERLRLFGQICAAVSYAHEKGIVHRDLKPGNILVTRNANVKLLDFGIAKILDSELIHETVGNTETLLRQMTPEYASPEQITGETITTASDVYSLGVILYELLTGERPYKFASRAPHEIARVVCETPLENPSAKIAHPKAAELGLVVLKALRKNPSARYGSAALLNRDIEKITAGLPLSVDAEPFEPRLATGESKNAAGDISLAVVPFRTLPLDKGGAAEPMSDEFLGVGLADALTTRLSRIASLVLRPTSSVLRAALETEDAHAIGKQVNADFVLIGHLLSFGERLRVSVQLLKTSDNSVLWAQQFDESIKDVFSLQDSISERVAASLVPQLTSEEQANLRRHGTTNAAAYEAYLRGRVYFHNYTFGGINAAENCFAEAVKLDPNFALAHCGLADFYNLQTIFGLTSNEEGFSRAKKSALKAIELDPSLAEAYAALAFTTWAFEWDFPAAERLFKKAVRLNPNYPRAHEWYALLLSLTEKHEEALAEMRTAERLDPNSPALVSMFSLVLYNARRYEQSLEKARRALELDPDYYIALQSLGWICPQLGKFDEAVAGCRRAVLISDEQALNKFSLALALIDVGQTGETRQIIAEFENRRKKSYVPAYYLALLYACLGEDEKAFDWFETAIEERGYYTLRMRIEPRLDRLRGDRRFARLLSKIKPLNESNITAEDNEISPNPGAENAALEAYKRGRAAAYSYTFEGIARSEKLFQEAIALDSDFAPAYSGLADFYNWQTIAGLVPPAMVQPAAKQAARRALELAPESAEAYASLAFATWAFDWDFAEAERLYRKSIALDAKNAKAREWFSYLLSSAGRHDEAIAEMQRAERLDADSPTVLAMFGLCFYYAGRYLEADEKIKRALEIDPDYYLALLASSWVSPQIGKFDEAVKSARRAVAISDELTFNKFSLALALISAGETAEAEKVAAEIERRRSERFAPAYYLSLIYANLNKPDEAFRWLDKAIEERGYWTLWLSVEPRFDCLRADSRFAECAKRINFLSPDNEKQQAAAPLFKNIQTRNKFKVKASAWAAMAALFLVVVFAAASYTNIIEKLFAVKPQTETLPPNEAQNLEPKESDKPRTKDAIADSLYLAGKQQLDTRTLDGVNRAITFFTEATKRDPDFALAFSGLADAHIVLADKEKGAGPAAYSKAEEYALKALTLDPDLAEARTSLAMATFKNTQNFAVAEKHFQRAIEINPRLARAHHWYSQLLSATNRPEAALREINIAAELEPNSAVLRYNVGAVNLEMKRYAEAIKHLEKTIELDKGYTTAYLTKGIAHQMLGDFDAAVESYRIGRIYRGKDENEPLWILIQAQAHAAKNRREEALSLLNNLLKNPANSQELYNLSLDVAMVYALLGDAEKACAWLAKHKVKKVKELDFISTDPRFANIHADQRFKNLIEKRRAELAAK